MENNSGKSNIDVRVIKGKVLNKKNGKPLSGVNIVTEGGNTGAVSDLNGNYKIAVPEGKNIMFSFVGFDPVKINTKNYSVLDVEL